MIFNHSKFTINPPLKKRYFGLVFGGHYNLAIQNISKKWNMPVQNWSFIIGQLDIFFTDRLKLDLA